MTEALRRTRAGHIGTITCVENKTRQILEKDPSLLTTLELATLRCSSTKYKEQQTKLETLNQQINEAMTAAEVEEDAFQEERNRVDENDLKSVQSSMRCNSSSTPQPPGRKQLRMLQNQQHHLHQSIATHSSFLNYHYQLSLENTVNGFHSLIFSWKLWMPTNP